MIKKTIFAIVMSLGISSASDYPTPIDFFIGGGYGNTTLEENLSIGGLKLQNPSENRYYTVKTGAILDRSHRISVSTSSYETNINDTLKTVDLGYEYLIDVGFWGIGAFAGVQTSLVYYNVDFGYHDIGFRGVETFATVGIGQNFWGTFGGEVGYRKSLFGNLDGSKIINGKQFNLKLDRFDQIYFSFNIKFPTITTETIERLFRD